eukprot:451980-Amphidinium_carterae.1
MPEALKPHLADVDKCNGSTRKSQVPLPWDGEHEVAVIGRGARGCREGHGLWKLKPSTIRG